LRKYTTGVLRQKVVARLKDDLAELRAAAQERFDPQPPAAGAYNPERGLI